MIVTENSIQIIWNESVYIDENGRSNRIMHKGVKYSEKSKSQPPTIVPRGVTITDTIVPVDNISYSIVGSGWTIEPLLPSITRSTGSAITMDLFEDMARRQVGEKIQILLALKIQDVINEYIFSFTINDIEIEEVQY